MFLLCFPGPRPCRSHAQSPHHLRVFQDLLRFSPPDLLRSARGRGLFSAISPSFADHSANLPLLAPAAHCQRGMLLIWAASRLDKMPGRRPRVHLWCMCRICLCTRFEHAIHVLVALWHYARHCCSAVLSLYDRLCSLLSALLSLARARVTRVFCIPFCFSLSICCFRAVTYCCRCQTAPHLRQVHGEGRESHACLTSVHVVGSQSHSDSPRSSLTGSPRSLSVPSS